MTINGHAVYLGDNFLNARNHRQVICRLREMFFMSHRDRPLPPIPASCGDVMYPISTPARMSIHAFLGEATSTDDSRSLS